VYDRKGIHRGCWGGGKLEERDRLDDLGIDGRVIGKWMLKGKVRADVDGVHLAQDKKWRTVVNSVMNFRPT
jgi:hypothetical protein